MNLYHHFRVTSWPDGFIEVQYPLFSLVLPRKSLLIFDIFHFTFFWMIRHGPMHDICIVWGWPYILLAVKEDFRQVPPAVTVNLTLDMDQWETINIRKLFMHSIRTLANQSEKTKMKINTGLRGQLTNRLLWSRGKKVGRCLKYGLDSETDLSTLLMICQVLINIKML